MKEKNKSRNITRLILRIFLTALIAIALVVYRKYNPSDSREIIENIQKFGLSLNNGLGNWVILLIIISLTIVFTLLSLPTLQFFMACGYFYGIFLGTFIAHILLVFSIAVTFLVYRSNFRTDRIKALSRNKWFEKIGEGLSQNELLTIIFTRAVYVIPYNVQNLVYSLSNVQFRKYVLGTLLGSIPVSIINVSLGYFLSSNTLVDKTRIIFLNLTIISVLFVIYLIFRKHMFKTKPVIKKG